MNTKPRLTDTLRARASGTPMRIVLPETADPRTRQAASYLSEHGICFPILPEPESSPDLERYAMHLLERRKAKGLSLDQAREMARRPEMFGALMVACGDADGCVCGAVATTADVLRAALYAIGLEPGTKVLSSVFLMEMPDGRVFTYGDCAVVPYPDAGQLAEIGRSSARTHRVLTGEEPRVAFLSFSTRGSAEHERVQLVREAVALAQAAEPDLSVDGELQFDAAVVPAIGERKAPGSVVAGSANVLVFPNLDAGNIGYKITERLAGATATGPLIQGLARPMHDLSRGASWEDIVNTAAVCAVQAAQRV